MIYLDNNATTQLDPRVLEEMLPFLKEAYGNASSNHEFGVSINQHVKEARSSVAELIGSEPNEIIFTSGATESINLALKGLADNYPSRAKHVVTANTEHPAVLDTCRYLEGKGYKIDFLPVQTDGLVSIEELKKTVRKDTLLVCVMFVNNETGVIQPIEKIAGISHSMGAFLMTDATQAVGKIPIKVDELGIDLMAFSGHKFYGPKGIGGLFVRSRRPNKVKLNAIIHGGGHERNYRSGTLNVPSIVGIGKAAIIAKYEMAVESKRIGILRDELEKQILKMKDTFLNGHEKNRLFNVSNIGFRGADADAIMVGLKDIIVSNGSACSSSKIEPSHVLKAIGKTDEEAYSSIRFSLGRFNTSAEVNSVPGKINDVVTQLRAMASPTKV